MKLRLLAGLAALLGLVAGPAAAQFTSVVSPTGPVTAGPYIIVDAHTGETLLQSNAGAPWYPASLTKLMTIYIVFQELKAGRLTLQTAVPFSAHAASMPPAKLGVGVGQSITVEQALESLVAHSANDVAAALGELVGGSKPAFTQRMTQTAAHLGMTATTFDNANGLPDPGNLTTARDLVILAMALIRDFPQYYSYFQTQHFMLGKRWVGPGVRFVRMYAPYADGLKTGFICASGFNLVGSAVRDGRRLIGVALGFRRADLRDEFLVRLFDEAYSLKTGGARPKVWQIHNDGGQPPVVFSQSECGTIRYDMPGDAAWLGTYGTWAAARQVYDRGTTELNRMGVAQPGKEYILPVTVNKATRQAAIIADLQPGIAQRLCADYHARKQFCEVKKPQDFEAPFRGFWR
ncbi:D-alanyl-D-alanine carboxypeptidase family protein [Enhydrobacter sp.]|jgi:D-alanyl-D-alanine carboxypeptidase|uniref:D-alanyl-D-alanine carboxypeptidase family protein n=1 Tax=Enhydrobacter sp. TaxID=1894999 RepID=UPI00261EA001|nr:D-alanyl-D-alanine carboxypeptidase family protein [Enhydrobacter sp.]WIM11572.1 MAG: D-alanyl-D-alanine carboxypeptidase [Enhydrobacter sp.]